MKHFFDIGGNVGQTFDWLATQGDRFRDYKLWIFEPGPRHFSRLLDRCAEERMNYQIVLCPFGVGGSNRLARFYFKDDNRGDSFVRDVRADHDQINLDLGFEIHAPIFELGKLIEIIVPAGDVVFLDIDAEGAEYEMLESLLASRFRHLIRRISGIITEFHWISAVNGEEPIVRRKAAILAGFSEAGVDIWCRGSVK